MAPSTTIGAVISLWRKAATKVMVCHAPSGTLPITRSPRSARPLSRTRFVLTAVSSMNTSRAGSNMPCSRIHRRRASATSARCCSAACRLFFEGDAVPVEKPPERAAAGFDPPLAQFRNRFDQGQIRLFGNESQDRAGELFQRRNASAAWLRRGAPALAPALQPLDRRTYAHLKSFGRLASRCAARPVSITRSRRSPEAAFGIASPISENQCTKTRSTLTVWESRRVKSDGNRCSLWARSQSSFAAHQSAARAGPTPFGVADFDRLSLRSARIRNRSIHLARKGLD